MSYHVLHEVMKHSEARYGARLVMFALADAADPDTGICWPRQEVLQETARLSDTAVREALRWLEQSGEIETRQAQRGRVRVNVYRVLVGSYALVDVTDAPIPFRLRTPFSRPSESDARGDDVAQPPGGSDLGRTEVGRPPDTGARGDRDDRPISAPATADDRRNSPLTTAGIAPKSSRVDERPKELSETRASNEALVPATTGKSEQTLHKQIVQALADGLNRKPTTRREHGRFGRVAAELAAAGATPEQVAKACRRWPQVWPNATATPDAIELHWSLLCPSPAPAAAAAQAEQWVQEAAPTLEDFDQVAVAIDSMRSTLGPKLAASLLASARKNWERRHAEATVGSAA